MYTTLSISNNSIRLLSIKRKRVQKWGKATLAAGLVRDGLITQPEIVGEAIRDLFKSTRIPKDKVIVSISGLAFTYRFLNLPRLKQDLLEEAISRGFKKEISLPLEDLYINWKALSGGEDEQTYFVLGISRYLIDAIVQTLEIAGIEPYIMDIQPLALARAANHTNAIIASLEPECFDIIIIADGLLTVIHTVIPRGEGATIEDNIRKLVDELNKTVTFYQSNHPNNELPANIPLLLTGELAEETSARELLESMTEYTVELLVPKLDFPSDIPVASYAINMGLALKKIPVKKPDKEETTYYHDTNINILSAKLKKPKKPQASAKSILLGVGLAIAIILLYPLYKNIDSISGNNLYLESRLQRVSRELNLANLFAVEAEITENTTRELSIRLDTSIEFQEEILSPRGIFTENFRAVTEELPEDLFLTLVDIDKEMIIVEGETDNVFTVIDYVKILENKGLFTEVSISGLDEDIPFIDDAEEIPVEELPKLITFKITITN